ncbi:hypothetical protein D3C73_999790 [compost metagenome]
MRQQEYGVLVEVDHVEPVFFTVVFGRCTADHPCTVNENIHFACQLKRLIEGLLQFAVIAQVGFDAQCLYAISLCCCYRFFAGVQRDGYHISACFGKSQGDPLAETLGCAGYDCCFACQTE